MQYKVSSLPTISTIIEYPTQFPQLCYSHTNCINMPTHTHTHTYTNFTYFTLRTSNNTKADYAYLLSCRMFIKASGILLLQHTHTHTHRNQLCFTSCLNLLLKFDFAPLLCAQLCLSHCFRISHFVLLLFLPLLPFLYSFFYLLILHKLLDLCLQRAR